jgi:hypothetical protein
LKERSDTLLIKIYVDDLDKTLIQAANKQLDDYLEFYFHPYDSLQEDYIIEAIFPTYLYRQNKEKCIEIAQELREWIKDSNMHTLTPLHEYALCSILWDLKQYDDDENGLLTRPDETEEDITSDKENKENDNFTLEDLKDLYFYLENCFEDYDFYDAAEYFEYAISDPNFEKRTNVNLKDYKDLAPKDIVEKYEDTKELHFVLKSMLKDIVTIEKQNGQIFTDIKANVQKDKILIADISLEIEEGDIIKRALSNGYVEEYIVVETFCFERKYGISAHYELEVRKLTSMNPTSSNGATNYYNIDRSVNTINGGNNNRLNKHTTDNSTNYIYTKSEVTVFDQIREKINESEIDELERNELLFQVDELEESINTPTFISRYQKFISSAANHMTIIAPLIPELTKLLSNVNM